MTNADRAELTPTSFKKFAAYMRNRDEWIGDFNSTNDGAACSQAWFDGDEEAASNFLIFGTTFSSGLFGFWLYPGVDLNTAPIVLLTSECEGSSVMAENFDQWLSCLLFGSDDFELDVPYSAEEPWTGPGEVSAELLELRQWCQSELGIVQSTSPAEVVVKAVASCPDLMAYIRNWQQKKYD